MAETTSGEQAKKEAAKAAHRSEYLVEGRTLEGDERVLHNPSQKPEERIKPEEKVLY